MSGHWATATGGHLPIWVQVRLRADLPRELRERIEAAGGIGIYYCTMCGALVGRPEFFPAV